MILLHFFGLGDVLRRFELEQLTGLNLMGFRPVALDDLVIWSQRVADQQRWDADQFITMCSISGSIRPKRSMFGNNA